MLKKRVCINCPRGCEIVVDTDNRTVTGNFCPRGKEYGISEVTHPRRTITSTAKIENGVINRVSVRTDKAAPKEKRFDIRKKSIDWIYKLQFILETISLKMSATPA